MPHEGVVERAEWRGGVIEALKQIQRNLERLQETKAEGDVLEQIEKRLEENIKRLEKLLGTSSTGFETRLVTVEKWKDSVVTKIAFYAACGGGIATFVSFMAKLMYDVYIKPLIKGGQ